MSWDTSVSVDTFTKSNMTLGASTCLKTFCIRVKALMSSVHSSVWIQCSIWPLVSSKEATWRYQYSDVFRLFQLRSASCTLHPCHWSQVIEMHSLTDLGPSIQSLQDNQEASASRAHWQARNFSQDWFSRVFSASVRSSLTISDSTDVSLIHASVSGLLHDNKQLRIHVHRNKFSGSFLIQSYCRFRFTRCHSMNRHGHVSTKLCAC